MLPAVGKGVGRHVEDSHDVRLARGVEGLDGRVAVGGEGRHGGDGGRGGGDGVEEVAGEAPGAGVVEGFVGDESVVGC